MSDTDSGTPFLSVIIPVLNEALTIQETLRSTGGDPGVEVIVVDGGSRDQTAELVRRAGAVLLNSPPGRARQLNSGAAAARGEVFLFLHGDTRLPAGFVRQVRETMARPGVAAGAFQLAIDAPQKRFAWIARAANFRARFAQLPYGDQALFLRAELFRELGGFPDLPIMEDFALVRSLRQQGRIHILDEQVITSARRWLRLGVWRTTCINQLMVVGFLLGLPGDFLAKIYGAVHKR